jgi:hypothetical protein
LKNLEKTSMSTTMVHTPTSRVQFGLARVDITPPVGFYHPMWGAARHHRATGIHRRLTCEVMVFAPLAPKEAPIIHVQMDHVGMDDEQHKQLIETISAATGVPSANVLTTFSHTHSSGNFAPNRREFPGGELIEPYLNELYANVLAASSQAMTTLQESVITYASGHCTLAANRDYWDEGNGLYACGFNADAPPADDTVLVARITDPAGALRASIVNYACHPTTLAWENTLISPDYIGAMREVVERGTGAPCIFALGACGDLGPRWGQQGNTAVADSNGRQLGYAALATLENMGPPLADYHYQGPVISGATLGDWRYRPFTAERMAQTTLFQGGGYTVHLPQKPRPDPVALEAELEEWGTKQQEADQRGDQIAARDYGARAERARRWILRVRYLPDRSTYPYRYSILRLGDAFWITCGGEPYNLLQTELRRRFPAHPIMLSPLAGDFQVAYLLPADRYGKGLYQEEPSILAPGCLEILLEAMAARITALS